LRRRAFFPHGAGIGGDELRGGRLGGRGFVGSGSGWRCGNRSGFCRFGDRNGGGGFRLGSRFGSGGATALGTADPDLDGYDNTTEFAFDGDPLAPTASLLTVAPTGGNITVTFLARVGNGTVWTGGNATGNGLNYEIQSSADLMLGFGSANDVSNIAPATDQTGIQPADFPYVRWEFQAPISGEKKFYRVKAVPQGVGDQ
jgi:hypothetical protein